MARDGKDSRLYGRFTLDFADSPKIAPLSDAAFRALVEMTLHSRRMLDDGFIDARIAVRKWRQEVIDELLTNDADKPSLVIAEGGYFIHDFADHQQTRADIEKKREAGAKGGKASAEARAQAPANQVLNQNATTPQAISESETETSTSNEVEARKRASTVPLKFEITDDMRSWARENTPLVDLDAKLPEWIDYWRGTGKTMKDWVSVWRNGMRKQQEFALRDAAKSGASTVEDIRNGFLFIDGKPVMGGRRGMNREQYDAWLEEQRANSR